LTKVTFTPRPRFLCENCPFTPVWQWPQDFFLIGSFPY
jgi:hypothetical protein